MAKRGFKGIWIPREIWESKSLTLKEKCFVVEIDSLDNEDGCFASNSYFADFFGINESNVSRAIKSLEGKGWITTEYEKNGKQVIRRIIRICRPPYPPLIQEEGYCENAPGYCENDKEGYCENAMGYSQNDKDNNTTNNTLYINNIGATTKSNKFKKPTIEEIREYASTGYPIDAERFYDYYESNGWKIGKAPMKDWKATVRNWSRNSKSQSKSDGGLSQW